MTTRSGNELELGDYLAVARRRWAWFGVPLLLLPLMALYLSAASDPVFQSTARVLLGDTAAQEAVGGTSQSVSFRNRLIENELQLATSDAAQAAVAEQFAVAVEDVPPATVSSNGDSDILDFRARSANAESAANVANAWAETYVLLKQQQASESITDAVATLESTLVELQMKRDEVRTELVVLENALASASDQRREFAQLQVDREASRISGELTLIDAQISATAVSITDLRLSADLEASSGARLISAAGVPTSPINGGWFQSFAVALLAGAALGAAAALVRDNLDRAIHDADDLTSLGLLHLGSVPAADLRSGQELALASIEDPDAPHAEAYQKVRTALEFLALDQKFDRILVTSAVQGEGKTTTAANLATAMARTNTRTILVDCDLRRPRLHRVFRTTQSPGLTNVVLDRTMLPEAAWPIPMLAQSLVVIPSGALPPHPASFLSSPSFGDTVSHLADLADFTIFDAPPVLPVADTLALVRDVDGVVMVVNAGSTSRNDVIASVDALEAAGARILGVVLVGTTHAGSAYQYRYDGDDDLDRLEIDIPSSDRLLELDEIQTEANGVDGTNRGLFRSSESSPRTDDDEAASK